MGVQHRAACLTSGPLPRLGTLLRLSGWWGRTRACSTPGVAVMFAFHRFRGHVGVVRWLLDHGASINQRDAHGSTALSLACHKGCLPVVRLLMERGADPTIANGAGTTPLMVASREGHLEVVRSLLGHRSARATLNQGDEDGWTALYRACCWGRGGVAMALLESGADPTIASNDGTTPMAIAKQDHHLTKTAKGRRECVEALEVRCSHSPSPFLSPLPAFFWGLCLILMLVVAAGGGAGPPAAVRRELRGESGYWLRGDE
jgi:ankyrin repeat protein